MYIVEWVIFTGINFYEIPNSRKFAKTKITSNSIYSHKQTSIQWRSCVCSRDEQTHNGDSIYAMWADTLLKLLKCAAVLHWILANKMTNECIHEFYRSVGIVSTRPWLSWCIQCTNKKWSLWLDGNSRYWCEIQKKI